MDMSERFRKAWRENMERGATDFSNIRRVLLLPVTICWISTTMSVLAASEPAQTTPEQEPVVTHIIRAPDWIGAVNVTDEGCNASMGEYTLWVYATETKCGVPRDEADRVSIIRQPLPGVAPIRSPTRLPGGRYAAWVYGAGDAEHLRIRLCAKTCLIGELPVKPGWVFLDWIELRDKQTVYLRSWQQPETHLLYVQAISLSTTDASPDWIP
jgi:hypothetical protein